MDGFQYHNISRTFNGCMDAWMEGWKEGDDDDDNGDDRWKEIDTGTRIVDGRWDGGWDDL